MSNPATQVTKLNYDELSIFCYNLSLIFKAGIPYLEGINLFYEEMSNPKLKKLAKYIYDSALEGNPLSQSLSELKAFPEYMISMIRIAEATSMIDTELSRLSDYYDKMEKMMSKIRSAVTYPIILAVLMGGIIILPIAKILPMFRDILISVGGEIPPLTKALWSCSSFIQNNYLIILAVLAVIILGSYFFLKTKAGRILADKSILKLPYIKTLYTKIVSAEFSMAMSMLLKGGIAFDDALTMIIKIIKNKYIKTKLEECRQDIIDGNDTPSALNKAGVFPDLLVKMLAIGYRTGEMEATMSKVAVIYENDVNRSIGRLTSSIEPLLVLILSVILGIILLAVMLPLINIMSSLG